MKKKSGPAKRVLVTAGATIEPLDPVRFISNFSTGTLGYEIAKSCKKRNFKVNLITAPTQLPAPRGLDLTRVRTAIEMEKAVFKQIKKCDAIIMAAAVCDFKPCVKRDEKIKKRGAITLKLVKNPDILERIGERKGLVKIGFSLESNNAVRNSEKKLRKKKLDLVVINVKTKANDPFGPGEKDFMLLYKNGRLEKVKGINKKRMANIIVDKLERLLGGRQ